MELNERIAQLRKQAGLTQEQMGERLGVSRQAVSKWESGQANPDVAYVAEMCRLFGVSSDWLLLGRSETAAAGPVCPGCGAALSPGDAFCSKCGVDVRGDRSQEALYCLYLKAAQGFPREAGRQIAELFELPWAKPAFPWDGGAIDGPAGFDIVAAAPIVLCQGLTYEEALQGAEIFSTTDAVKIYREDAIGTDGEGQERPVGDPVSPPREPKKPMGPGTVFLMVVLGVIAALLLMSLF